MLPLNESDHPDWSLIERYLSGAATPGDHARLDAWVADQPERRIALDVLQSRWDAARSPQTGPDRETESALRAMHNRMAVRGVSVRSYAPYRGPAVRRPLVVGVGAVLAAGVALVFALRIAGSRAPGVLYATGRAERETVTLADGSRITLGPVSRIRITLTNSARNVALDGEAYFVVVHDAAHPFSVRARDAIATDIGTQFDVRAYGDDRAVRVAVSEGRVGLEPVGVACRRPGDVTCGTTLSGGDVASLDQTSVTVSHAANLAPYLAWVQGRLAYDDTPLPQVVADLARTFDLQIEIADAALGAETITGTFGEETADEVLDAITRSIGAEYVRHGRTVLIRHASAASEHCGSQPHAAPLTTVQRTDHNE